MTAHESMENYLEVILVLSMRRERVRSVDIAATLGFSKPSVSVAMKKLREQGYVALDGRGGIALTETGRAIAARTYDRHLLLAESLMRLGVSEETAHEDACRIEHVISAETCEKLRAHAGRRIFQNADGTDKPGGQS